MYDDRKNRLFKKKTLNFMFFRNKGCILVPLYVSYMQISSRNPLIYFGLWCIVAIVCTNLLPETSDDILDYVEDSPKVSLLQKKDDFEMVKLKRNVTQDDFN